jgi:hypothetical protein
MQYLILLLILKQFFGMNESSGDDISDSSEDFDWDFWEDEGMV